MKLFAHAQMDMWEIHLHLASDLLNQNVLLILTVQITWLVFNRDAKTHVHPRLVEGEQFVESNLIEHSALAPHL